MQEWVLLIKIYLPVHDQDLSKTGKVELNTKEIQVLERKFSFKEIQNFVWKNLKKKRFLRILVNKGTWNFRVNYSLWLKIGIRTIPLFIRTGGGPEPNIEFSLNLLLWSEGWIQQTCRNPPQAPDMWPCMVYL